MRFLDRTKRIDYFVTFLIAAIPVALSILLGVDGDIGDEDEVKYRGYLRSLNFTAFVVLLPGMLWFFRWAMGRIASVGETWEPKNPPPLAELFESPRGQREVYGALRRQLLSPRLVWLTLVVVVLIHILDLRSLLVEQYIHDKPPLVPDWRAMFQHSPEIITKTENLVFVFFAYSVQFTVTFFSLLLGFLLASHNLFFLRRIYQRRWVPDGEEDLYIHIDLADGDRCFGFRRANNSFNTQVLALGVGGIAMLLSRFIHAAPWVEIAAAPEKIFPTVGQVILALGWFFGFLVVSLPSLVKLLPRLQVGGSRASRSVTTYMREFLAPDRWPFGREPSQDEIGALAAHFANNSFWPTGDNRARQLFFFAMWVGLIVLFTPPMDNRLILLVSLPLLGILAYGGRRLLFRTLDGFLAYVDPRLVELPEGGVPDLRLPGKRFEAGVFISYRRADSAAYTGRLYDHLIDHFHRDQIFIDIDDIDAGDKFPEVLEKSLESSWAVIVMIGARWLSIEGDDGKRRLDDPDDWVRLEVATALRRNVKVFPVLVGGAQMPSAQDLPDELAPLAAHHASEITDKRWDYDARQLMETIRKKWAESRRNET